MTSGAFMLLVIGHLSKRIDTQDDKNHNRIFQVVIDKNTNSHNGTLQDYKPNIFLILTHLCVGDWRLQTSHKKV